ncbi:MAG: PAS domain S-box protein [Deltaproteobacteria bacterium]|nr:PAS domain S-box protein [Deltaproteobacteria bacterium]
MTAFSKIELEGKVEEAKKEIEHYKRISKQTGDLYLKETEALSKLLSWRKQAEQELRESKELLRAIIESTADGILVVNEKGQVICANESFFQLWRIPEELIKKKEDKKLLDFVLDQLKEPKAFLSKIQAFYKTSGENFDLLNFKDGRVFERYSSPLIRNGQIAGRVWNFRDITDRKRSEEALQESKERFKFLTEKIADIIWTVNLDFQTTYVSPSIEKILGFTPEERKRQTLEEMITPESLKRVQMMFLEELRRDEAGNADPDRSVTIEVEYYRKDGSTVWMENSMKAMRDNSGAIDGIYGVSRDITERKIAEEEKTKLQSQLQHVQKMESIGTLAGGIAHDFNNMLGIIVGNTELAMDDVPDWNPARHNLEEIRIASMRAKDVVRQILAFSRQSPQEMKPVRISRIIKESLELLRSSIPTTIEIHQNISSESDTVRADPTQINQVLINLCTNAVHAMGERGGRLEVSLKNIELDECSAIHHNDLSLGKYVRLTVSDTGHGIEPKILERIFDPYFTTKGIAEGSGMGLSVVHGIVKTHGGYFLVDSELGKGTTFQVFFPYIESNPEPEIEITVEIPRGKERILFIDDEKAMVDTIQPMIERLGYKVTARTSSIEALEAFRSNPDRFDLVITDFTMPNMTGMELAKELFKLRSDIPIILCTGYSIHINEDKAKRIGIRAFAMKPIVLNEIANTIRTVLDDD